MKTRLIVFNLNWLGDILLSIPNLRTLRHHYKESHIACIIPKAYRDLFQGQTFIDEIIAHNDRSPYQKIKLIRHLRSQRWDIGFLFHRSKTRARIFKWSGVRERIGYNTNRRSKLLTTAIPEPGHSLHKMDYLLQLMKNYGIEPVCDDYSFVPSFQNIHIPKPYVVFHPGSNWEPKKWPTDYYARLGDRLSQKYQTNIVITGVHSEKSLASALESQMKQKCVNLCGKTTLIELANILKNASLVVSGDTGPMHLAAAVGAPILPLYGPTSPELNGPRGKGVSRIIWENPGCLTYPCADKSCPHRHCLNDLLPEKVFQTIENWGILNA
jgi:ADP-heptose:LPS heptosyltransferase